MKRLIKPCCKVLAFLYLVYSGLNLLSAEKGGKIMQLKSSAFGNGQPIPVKYTGQGRDVSPPLEWSDAPAGAKSFAIISDDPDAPVGTWVHWVIYDIPANITKLDENVPPKETLPNGAKQGINDFGNIGYGGPMPPPGKPHRYFFKLYALDTVLNLKPRASKQELLRAMQGHILAQAELMGTYQRK
ncbi:MAG: YbhB/YbcL family Raf kinase inhibitor-like protein [Verrucomicrobiia bacterium]